MRAVFADTFYWIAVTNRDDFIQQEALSASRTASRLHPHNGGCAQ
jgi:hypothetical protein